MEEEKETYEVEPIETKDVSTNANNKSPLETSALTAFILCCIGVTLCGFSYFGSISCLVLQILAINFNKKAEGVTTKPYSVFHQIVKYAAIGFLVLAIIILVSNTTKDFIKLFNFLAEKAHSSESI